MYIAPKKEICMSIKSIGTYLNLNNFKKTFRCKPLSKGQFSFTDTKGQSAKVTSLHRESKNLLINKQETTIGNKRHVVISKYDYSQYPAVTTLFTKRKGFVDGELVFYEIQKKYLSQSFWLDGLKK